ncbi:response regulator, partial [Ruminococcaceae bacterium OttesenSCG-928-N02]|nr:response regulator [Ruminococcaceae bacterium OttesenSCG-928-N02]
MNKLDQTILIVDDTELNRSLLQDILGSVYKTMEATNGLEALEILSQHHEEISLVLLDVVMPEMDGFEVLVQMNEKGYIKRVPVIMISAETAPESINRGYELGVADYINRPFDAGIIKRRIHNTIMLYAKQKNLERIVAEQIQEKEKSNALMVDILSTIVEFRNGESGMHVRRIRIITEILLEMLSARFPQYKITPSKIAVISNAAALHDVGKISIPEEILNKPGILTAQEFEVMKTHAKTGAEMLEKIPFADSEELVRYAHDICLHHHERWDGSGYPEGLAGNQIPIEAQVVAVADVYDALVSERVYKPAYTPQKAIEMILNGECGAMNPDLLYCLALNGEELEGAISAYNEPEKALFNTERISQELIAAKESGPSDRTISLLEREQTKYRFLAALSQEILFDYDTSEGVLTFSEKGYEELGLESRVQNVRAYLESAGFASEEDVNDFIQKLMATTAEKPVLQVSYLLNRLNGEKRWYEIIVRAMWSNELVPTFMGCIGKMQDIHSQRIETSRLRKLAERDSLTGLLNHNTA